ncbi:hypothetical protein Tco_1015394 [Tanacetum coccineum]|uniref:Uncharacterized protein n=1 Tax=Tanacetum coccineum TaxID=301880 RepID=A0ABQ5FL76_9ASTR
MHTHRCRILLIAEVILPSLNFDMHLYKSSLTKSHVKYLVKLYGIPEDLHPRVAPKGLSNVWKHVGGAFSLKDSERKGKSILVIVHPVSFFFFRPIRLIIVFYYFASYTPLAEFLRLPNIQGCKVHAGALLHPVQQGGSGGNVERLSFALEGHGDSEGWLIWIANSAQPCSSLRSDTLTPWRSFCYENVVSEVETSKYFLFSLLPSP